MNTEEFFEQIDWSLLRKQKEDLLKSIEVGECNQSIDSIKGIVNLIDSMQDYMVNELGYNKLYVLGSGPENPALNQNPTIA